MPKRLVRLASSLMSGGPKKASVLMVCMGNICRSPTAEVVLRDKLRRAGLAEAVVVDSAGTHGYHVGAPPDGRAIEHAARRGYDLSELKARRVTAGDFARFDQILAMDGTNLDYLLKRYPDAQLERLGLLLERAAVSVPHSGHPLDVPDPYYGGREGFELVLDLIEPACDALVAQLVNRAKAPR